MEFLPNFCIYSTYMLLSLHFSLMSSSEESQDEILRQN